MILITLIISFFINFSFSATDSSQNGFLPEMLKMRDPFRKPEGRGIQKIIKSELEKYSISEFKMVGVSTGPTKMRALVSAPDGKSYFVAEGVKIGLRGGIVRKITPEGIQVREKIVNIIGEEENVDSEIKLVAESKFQIEHKQQEANEEEAETSVHRNGSAQSAESSPSASGGNMFMNAMKEAIKAAISSRGAQTPAPAQEPHTVSPVQSQQTQQSQQPQQPEAVPDWAKPKVLGIGRGNESTPGSQNSLGGSK